MGCHCSNLCGYKNQKYARDGNKSINTNLISRNIIITGQPQSGKTLLLSKLMMMGCSEYNLPNELQSTDYIRNVKTRIGDNNYNLWDIPPGYNLKHISITALSYCNVFTIFYTISIFSTDADIELARYELYDLLNNSYFSNTMIFLLINLKEDDMPNDDKNSERNNSLITNIYLGLNINLIKSRYGERFRWEVMDISQASIDYNKKLLMEVF